MASRRPEAGRSGLSTETVPDPLSLKRIHDQRPSTTNDDAQGSGEVMPLTPEDVSNKRFTPVRLREGYDMGEVDQFLDEVEAELDRMVAENNDLRAKLAAALDGHAGNGAIAMPAGTVSEQAAEKVADQPVDTGKGARIPAAVTAPREEIKVVTAAEASKAALRLLELATNNADAVLAEAKEEAVQLVDTARTDAQRLESESKAKIDKLEEEARLRAGNLDSETEAKRAELLGDTQREKARLDSEVENLRAFEREYRSRLRSYFNQQLQALDSSVVEGGDEPAADDADGPKRLRSVLDDGGDEATSGSFEAPEAAAEDVSEESPTEGQGDDHAQGENPDDHS
jgi:DivIVA domain-containing protein